MDDDDEIILELATQLRKIVFVTLNFIYLVSGDFVDHVGGPQYAHEILPILQSLATVDEKSVRDAAVASFTSIMKQLPQHQVDTACAQSVRDLSQKEWSTARTAACAIIPSLIQCCSESVQRDMLELFDSVREAWHRLR